MIILDTNVISEMMKSSPSLKVMTWIDQQSPCDLFVTTITIAEISYGLHILPVGNRRKMLEDAFYKSINQAFEHCILGFDALAADCYGRLMADRKKIGKPLSILDGQIAAIARVNHFQVATRNISDFSDCGLALINPF